MGHSSQGPQVHSGGAPVRILLLALMVASLAGCGGQDAPESGVEGTVSMGPMCPVVQEGVPCPDQPLRVKLAVESPSGKDVAEAVSDGEGKYRIPLEAGEYVLVPQEASAAGVASVSPQSFTVDEGAWTTVDIRYDTGLR